MSFVLNLCSMREDWEVRKWNEVLSIVNGKNQKGVENNNGFYPIYGSGGIMGYADNFLCPENTVIIGRKGNINKPIFVKEKFWNVDTAFGLISKSGILDSKFLFYFCVSYNFEKLNKAVTIPSLTKSDLLNIKIDLPPLQTQHQIVEELDSLTSIIEKQKKQLEELDNLAQAIFYDMFGDPIENEKGWEKSSFGREFKISSGGTPDTRNQNYWNNGNISWIGSNLCHNSILYKNDGKYITEEGLLNSSAKIYNSGYVLVALVGATIGKAAMLKFSTTTNQNIAGIDVNSNPKYTSEFIFFTLKSLYPLFLQLGGDKFKMANLSFVRALPLISPPLSFQQQFASKIEAIEKQKELIKKSIKETEDLFNSRMDYYFN